MLRLKTHPGFTWFVLHTRSRQEKILSRELSRLGISNLVPLARRVRHYNGRRAIVDEPLFPGYCFMLGTVEQSFEADRTKRVANIIRVANQERLDWELTNIQKALRSAAHLAPHPRLVRGARVEIRSGPFRGLQGIVDGGASRRLILQVEMLGQAISLEVGGDLLHPID